MDLTDPAWTRVTINSLHTLDTRVCRGIVCTCVQFIIGIVAIIVAASVTITVVV